MGIPAVMVVLGEQRHVDQCRARAFEKPTTQVCEGDGSSLIWNEGVSMAVIAVVCRCTVWVILETNFPHHSTSSATQLVGDIKKLKTAALEFWKLEGVKIGAASNILGTSRSCWISSLRIS
ncbi:hypothetical protein M0R45_001844 [Rubus argutus]|uniref:Uncharacterized protein n=1 Tax=Rubus argutus TaxID=59490 RepID=A0AAW1VFF8_RUBAR